MISETEGKMEPRQQRNKSKLLIGLALVIVGIGLLVWALAGRSANAPSGESVGNRNGTNTSEIRPEEEIENPDQSVANDEAETATITFTKDGFNPETLNVKKGTTVVIKNESSQRVQFSSDDHPTHRLNEGMNLGVLAPGESDSFVASEVGEWGFHDHIDDRFTGSIMVSE